MHPILYTTTAADGIVSLQPVILSNTTSARKADSNSSNAWCAEGDFGSIFLEEFYFGHFIVRLTFFHLLKNIILYYSTHKSVICMRIITKNRWSFDIGSEEHVNLSEGQFILYRTGVGEEKINFKNEGEYSSVEVYCPIEKLLSFVQLFPALKDFLNITTTGMLKPSFLSRRGYWIAPEALEIVRNISKCPFDDSIRDYYMQRKLEHLFFLLMMAIVPEEESEEALTEDEISAVHVAERIIMTDIKRHYPIPTLAKKVGLNEFRLKYIFKHTFKTGIFEYLLKARMQEAKKLLIYSNKPIKEIASLIGYQFLTSFITAFRKYFGHTPGSVRKAIPDILFP
jgi:AraC-like DNA-binding protein